MTKNAFRGIIVLVILMAVFSVIAFVIPFPKNTAFWIAYGCGMFAILFQLYIFWSSFGRKDARSRFYGFPIARLGIYYLIFQLLTSIAEIALAKFVPAWVVILINALILGAALIGCITTETMRDEVAAQDGKLRESVSNMREMQSITALLQDRTGNAELKKILQNVADEFRYSDPVTTEKTAEMEMNMMAQLKDIQQAVNDSDIEAAGKLCSKLTGCLAERNRICSLNKKVS